MADRSVRGLQRSFGLMVNYQYNTDNIADNEKTFVSTRTRTSKDIDSLLITE